MSRMTLSSMCLIRNPQCPPSTPLLDPLFLTHFQQRYCHDNFKVSSLGSTNVIHEPWGYWEEGPSDGPKAQRPRLNKQDWVPFRSEANCCSDRDLVLMTFSRANKTKHYHVWWLVSSRGGRLGVQLKHDRRLHSGVRWQVTGTSDLSPVMSPSPSKKLPPYWLAGKSSLLIGQCARLFS